MTRLMLPALLLAAMLLALLVGLRFISPGTAYAALTAPDMQNPDHVTLLLLRPPRLVAGLVAGVALGLAGVLMRGLTRNPLAEPGLLGVNAGAALAVVAGALITGRSDGGLLTVLAFPGALAAMIAVFLIGGGSRGGAGPMRLALAGATLNALFLSLTMGIVLLRADGAEVLRYWSTGSLSQAATRPLAAMAVVVAMAAAASIMMAPALDSLALGEAMARGLGTRTGRVKALALCLIALLSGAAVAVAGPITFLGLMVPELARRLTGAGLRGQMLAALCLGPVILLLADVAGRLVMPPTEVKAGLMVALIGGPLFIWLARRIRPGAMA